MHVRTHVCDGVMPPVMSLSPLRGSQMGVKRMCLFTGMNRLLSGGQQATDDCTLRLVQRPLVENMR